MDDTLFMATRWWASGGSAELAVYPDGIQAFNSYSIGIARAANARIRAFLSQCVESGR